MPAIVSDDSKHRSLWVDVARGVAISLVVFGHAWRGLYSDALIETESFRILDDAIYAFHMPLFFMISGFFFFGAIRRGKLGDRIKAVTGRLLVPLVLWTYIFLVIRWIFSDFTNAQPDASSLFVLPVPGILHFWFLWSLWVIQVGFLLFVACLPARLKADHLLIISMILAILVWVSSGYLPVSTYLGTAYFHAIFFVSGAIACRVLEFSGTNKMTAGIALAIFAGLIGVTQIAGLSSVAKVLLALSLSGSLLIFVKGLCKVARPGLGLLQWAGRCSFAIYMMHTIFSAGVRELLVALGISALSVHLPLAFVAGITAPILVSRMAAGSRVGAILRIT